MHILAVSNLGPSPANPMVGVFVEKRFAALAQIGASSTLVTPQYRGRVVEAAMRLQAGLSVRTPSSTGGPMPPPWRQVPVAVRPWELPAAVYGDPRASTARIAGAVLDAVGSESYDLIQAHGMYAFWAGGIAQELSRRIGVPYTVTVHGSDLMQLKPWRRTAFRRVAGGAAGFCFVSRALAEVALQHRLVPGEWAVTPNGFDGSVFNVHGRGDSESLRVLFVGNLVHVKGADRLPALFRALHARVPRLRLEIVGDGPLRGQLERELAGEAARFTGRLPSTTVAQRMREADVLVLPSRSEGFGTVLVEARACGARVVATAVGGTSEAVGSGGETVAGAPFDPGSMADAVLRQWQLADPGGVSQDVQTFEWKSLGRAEVSVLNRWLGTAVQ